MKNRLRQLLRGYIFIGGILIAGISSPAVADITRYDVIYQKTEVGNPSRIVTFFQYLAQDIPNLTHPRTAWGLYVGELSSAISSQQLFTGEGRFDRGRIGNTWSHNPCCTGQYPGLSRSYASENSPFVLQNSAGQFSTIYECQGFVNGLPRLSVLIPGQPIICLE